MDKKKELKHKAALAAVMMYIDEEMTKQNQASQQMGSVHMNNWGQYGRQNIMTNRGIMQLKLRKR